MGSYDNLYDYDIRCPRCGERSEYDIQTKDLGQLFDSFFVMSPGDLEQYDKSKGKEKKFNELSFFYDKPFARSSRQLRFVTASYSCESPSCRAVSSMVQYLHRGYISGFSLAWTIRYKVREHDGLVIGPAEFEDLPWIFKDYGYKMGDEPKILKAFVEKVEADCGEDAEIAGFWARSMNLAMQNPALAVLYFHGDSPNRKKGKEG